MAAIASACDDCNLDFLNEAHKTNDIRQQYPEIYWQAYYLGRTEGLLHASFIYRQHHESDYPDNVHSLLREIDLAQDQLGINY